MDKMVPPVQVSQLIKFGRYSALILGMAYGAKHYSYLKPRAEEERRIAAEDFGDLDGEKVDSYKKCACAEFNYPTVLGGASSRHRGCFSP
ncbi:ATP synthase subunit e, mitochondrial-like [Psammomys obesus]|uniref:ATP synthase subunit e, mitochondrial-like n=1 Tax=Psammomys obesus TaxID=48139 RepID=UPI002452AC62|nr:ATP synthase subunit e, mitochondrial-like [Psammomys obesus]